MKIERTHNSYGPDTFHITPENYADSKVVCKLVGVPTVDNLFSGPSMDEPSGGKIVCADDQYHADQCAEAQVPKSVEQSQLEGAQFQAKYWRTKADTFKEELKYMLLDKHRVIEDLKEKLLESNNEITNKHCKNEALSREYDSLLKNYQEYKQALLDMLNETMGRKEEYKKRTLPNMLAEIKEFLKEIPDLKKCEGSNTYLRNRVAFLAQHNKTIGGFVEAFNYMAKAVHKNACEKGFWEEDRSDAEAIALMHSELSEALESIRSDHPQDDKCPDFTNTEVELADCIIRIADTAEKRGYRVAEALEAKMVYNTTRPYKHGKEF